MKLYSVYTESHEILHEQYFLPTLKDNYELHIKKSDIIGKGIYLQEDWMRAIYFKIDTIIEAIKENWEDIFIFSDVDIQFFKPTKEFLTIHMGSLDFLAQKDHVDSIRKESHPELSGHICTGFFACRGNEKTLKLWKEIKNFCMKNTSCNDQRALNFLLNGFNPHKKNNAYGIRWEYLPPEFYSAGPELKDIFWKPNMKLTIPENVILHHANWAIGIENKIKQLEYVRNIDSKQKLAK